MIRPLHRSLRMAILAAASLPTIVAGCAPADAVSPAATTEVLVDTVRVMPDSVASHVGRRVQLVASVRDQNGRTLAGASVRWASTDPAVATVDSTGSMLLIGTGTAEIRASRGGKSGRTKVVSTPEPVASVRVSPGTLMLTAGQQATVSAVTLSAEDSVLTGRSVAWASSNPAVLTVDPSGVVRAIGAGTAAITATSGSAIGQATASVTAATIQALTISPAAISLIAGEQQFFAVSAVWSNGATTAPSVVFSASGGTVTSGGIYVAGGTAGTYRVIVRDASGTAADTSVVTITAASPILQAVVLTPATVSLTSGATRQFGVSGQWSNGATTAPSVTYAATGGTITAAGLYTVGSTAGTYRVIATQQGGPLADTSVVTITAASPILQAVVLTPATVSLASGATRQFGVSGQWSNGATTAPSVTYAATGGTITAAGLYTAGSTAGTYRVIATQQGGPLSDTSAVTITAASPILQAVVLTPSAISLAAGATQQFGVSGQWSDGATTAPGVSYVATGGTITAAGLFAAGSTAGTYRVIAQQSGGTLADTSSITIPTSPPPTPGAFNPYANRPANYTVVESDYAFDTPIPAGGDTPVPDGSGWNQVFNNSGNMRRGSDPASPVSPGNVLEWHYRAGSGSPTSSAGFGHLYRPASTSITSWYISFPVWHDANFEFNAVSNKLLGIWSQTGSNLMESRHFQGDFLSWQFEALPGVPYYRESTAFGGSLTDSYFRGHWVNIEVQYVMSPTQGSLRVWAARNDGSDGPQGRLVLEYQNINVPLPGSLQELQLNSTWGGGSGPTTRDSFRRIDHILLAHP